MEQNQYQNQYQNQNQNKSKYLIFKRFSSKTGKFYNQIVYVDPQGNYQTIGFGTIIDKTKEDLKAYVK